jgi:hypothetical protein
MKKLSGVSFVKNFTFSLSVGFFVGLGVVFYFLGPRGIRQQVCRGYVENAQSLAESRAEKESYLESFVPRSGDILVEVAQVEGEEEAETAEVSALLDSAGNSELDLIAGEDGESSAVIVKSLPASEGVKPAVKHVAKKVSRYRKNFSNSKVASQQASPKPAIGKSKKLSQQSGKKSKNLPQEARRLKRAEPNQS